MEGGTWSRKRTGFAVLAVVALALVHARPGSAERCDWSVSGTLKVENARLSKMRNKFGEVSPLENVLVKVSARTRVGLVWGTWNAWPKTRTDASGRFTVANRKNCAKRQIRVQVKFDDANLEIRHETATSSTTKVKWYEVVNDGKSDRERTSSTVNLGTLEFQPGGSLMLGDFEARRHAELWNFYQMIVDHMAAKGPSFAFESKIKVKYPHDSWIAGDILSNTVEGSYCNPTTKVIYIHKDRNGPADDFDVETLAHELGHKWAYERFHGEICLTMDLIGNGDTHDLADDPCVAFHEGFAKFWQQHLESELLDQEIDLPYNRPRLNAGVGSPSTRLTNLSLMQRMDEGWWSTLTTMTTPLIHRYDFGTPGGSIGTGSISLKSPWQAGCTSPDITFKNVLNVFQADAGAGYPEDLSRDDTTIAAFMDRADAIMTRKMDREDRDMYVALADPASSEQPSNSLCGVRIDDSMRRVPGLN